VNINSLFLFVVYLQTFLGTFSQNEFAVMAGKFSAVKVKCELNAMGGCHCMEKSYRKFYYWYSPDAKAIVKFERVPSSASVYDYMKYELVSFELK